MGTPLPGVSRGDSRQTATMKEQLAKALKLKAIAFDASKPKDERRKAWAEFQVFQKKIQTAAEKAKKVFPHVFFDPNPPQARFLKMIDEGVRLRGHYDFAATFGTWTGKTALLALIMANLTHSQKAPCFQQHLPLFKEWPFSKHIRIGCAPDQMNELTGTVWLALSEWMPKDGSWDYAKAGKHYPSQLKLPGGWTADVKSYDQSGEGKESADIGLYLFDEPPPLDDWYRAAGRRKHGGLRIIFGSFIEDSGDQPALFEEILGDPSLEYFFAPTDQNLDDYKEVIEPFGECRGYLPAETTRAMMAKWPKHNSEARRSGKPNIMSAQVFKIEPDVHLVDRKDVPKELTVKLAFDPHDVRPGVIVVGGWDKDGSLWIIGEWPSMESHQKAYPNIQTDELGNKQYSDLIDSIVRKYGVRTKIIDSNFADTTYKHDNQSTTLRRELWNHGRHMFINGVKDVMGKAGGVARLRELLQVVETARGKRSKLYIVNDLHNCIEGMTRLKRRKMKDELTGKVSDELEERYLDYPRCIMYLAMSAGTFKPNDTAPVVDAGNQFGHTLGAGFESRFVEKLSAMSQEADEADETAGAAIADEAWV